MLNISISACKNTDWQQHRLGTIQAMFTGTAMVGVAGWLHLLAASAHLG
jgi:hypothetical protein